MGAVHVGDFSEQMFRAIPATYYVRVELPYSDDRTERTFIVWHRSLIGNKHTKFATFRARALPGCCGVLCIYYLRPTSTGKGARGDFLKALGWIEKAAALAKYGSVLLTQTMGTTGQEALGEPLHTFTNHKTGNVLALYNRATVVVVKKKPTFDGGY